MGLIFSNNGSKSSGIKSRALSRTLEFKMAGNTDHNILGNLVTLGAVALGWILGETTGWLKSKRKVNNLKNALFEEIKDGLSWLERNQLTLEKIIQLIVLNHYAEEAPVPVPTHIYDTHFPEISVHLTRSERISYNSIYNLIRISQEQVNNIVRLRINCISDGSKKKEYSETLEAAYRNVSMAIWQIEYHLHHGSKIDTDRLSGDVAKQIEKKIQERLIKILNEAKKSNVDEIKLNYYKT